MRVLVTGKTGQLGRALQERVGECCDASMTFLFAGRDLVDLERPETLENAFHVFEPDVVLNTAAYTAVDQAEDEPDRAMAVNAVGAGRLAEIAERYGARLVHISTDYVFDGASARAYLETDACAPQTAYGRSKMAGEMRVREAGHRHVIVRTAWVYSPFGSNFPKTMLRLASSRDEIAVVRDQVGNPTSALDLADGLIEMCRCWLHAPEMGLGQTLHLAGSGDASWADVARAVLQKSAEVGGPTAVVKDIVSADYLTKAGRPANSRLNCELFREVFGYQCPDWRVSLESVVQRLVTETMQQHG